MQNAETPHTTEITSGPVPMALTVSPIDSAVPALAPLEPHGSIGVVIPGYGHPRFLAEAVMSACEQACENPVYVIIVDDGCRFPETAETAQALMRRYPGKLFYLRQPNTRLPGARNAGIRFLLQMQPDLSAIFFLDADNRLAPHALQAYYQTLSAHSGAAWAYPDINFFGMTWGINNVDARITSRNYSVLKHLMGNISEAGSLVHADIFRASLMYDESMRFGFEDWEFWLQLLSAGYRGVRAENAGFFYRRRSESMLTDSRRIEEGIIAGMRRKHAALYHVRNLLRLEHEEAPALAVYLVDAGQVLLFSDPLAEHQTITHAAWQTWLTHWFDNPHEHFFPVKTLVIEQAAWDALCAVPHWLRWFFWRVRDVKAEHALLHLHDMDKPAFSSGTHEDGAGMPLMGQRALQDMLLAPQMVKPRKVAAFDVSLPGLMPPEGQGSAFTLDRLKPAPQHGTPQRHLNKRYAGPSAMEVRRSLTEELMAEEGRQPFSVATPTRRLMLGFDMAAYASRTDMQAQVAAICTRAANGGLELLLALEGWSAGTFPLLPSVGVSAVIPFAAVRSPRDGRRFMGCFLPNRLTPDAREDGSLAVRACDMLLVLGASGLVEIMGEAKAYGVQTAVILTQADAINMSEEAQTRLLAYEHAIGHIVCEHKSAGTSLSAHGVPPAKIVNAADFYDAYLPTSE